MKSRFPVLCDKLRLGTFSRTYRPIQSHLISKVEFVAAILNDRVESDSMLRRRCQAGLNKGDPAHKLK